MFMKAIAFIGTFRTATIALKAFRGSDAPILVTSLAHNPAELPCMVRALAASFHLITNGYQMFGFWMQCCSVVCIARDMCLILQQLRPSKGSGGNVRSQRSVNVAMNYRSLLVLQGNFAALYRQYMTLINSSAILSVVCSMYLAVVMKSGRSLILGLVIAFSLSKLLQETALVFAKSSEVLNEWRRLDRRLMPLWFGKFLRSCRPANVPVGSFFYVDGGLFLTVLSIITNASASLILAA